MRNPYLKLTDKIIRKWWSSIEDLACLDHEELAELQEWLTDLSFVEAHAERGLAFELAANYQRVLTLWESLQPATELPRASSNPELWLRECVSAVIDDKPDPHPDRGAGPILASLLRRLGEEHGGTPVTPQYHDGDHIPDQYFGQGQESVQALESMRATEQADQADSPTTVDESPLQQLRAFAAFIGSNSHILANEPQQTIPLAYNAAASGIVAQRAEAVAVSLDLPWFARDPRPPLAPDRPLLRRTLSGHSGPVQAVAISGIGAVLVSGGEDRTVRVWDVMSGRCVHVLKGQQAAIERLAITPDGTKAVSCARTEDRDVSWHLWDLHDGLCLGRSSGEHGTFDGIALSADGRVIVTVEECVLRVWDATWGTVVRSIGDSSSVNGMPVAITPDAKLAATAAGDDIVLWDLARGQLLRILTGHTHMVKALAYSADGKLLVSASHDDRIRLWDVTSGRCLREMSVPRDGLPSGIRIEGCEGIEHLCLSRDGRVAATGSAFSKYVRVWDLASGECVRTLLDDLRSPAGIALAADAILAATAAGEDLRVWDIAAGSKPASLPRYSQPVHHVASSRDGTSVVTLSDLQPCALWDGDSGRVRHTHESQHDNGYPMRFSDAALTADGRMAVVSSARNSLLTIDTSGGEIREMRGHELSIQRVCVGPCDRLAVSGDHDHTGTGSDNRNHLSSVNVWAIASGRWLRRLRGPHAGIRDLAPLPDGRRIVSCDGDHIHVWDWAEGKSVGVIRGRQWAARWLEAGPDGTLVATMGESPWVHVWDLSAGRCVAVLEVGQRDDVMDMAFTPDGRRLLVGSRLGTIQVCELRTGACTRLPDAREGGVLALRPTGDGSCCLAVGLDQVVRLWDLRTGVLLASYSSRSPRADHGVKRCRASGRVRPDGRWVLGTADGHVHFLTLRGFGHGVPYVTAGHLWRAVLDDRVAAEAATVPHRPLFGPGESVQGGYDADLTAVCVWCGCRISPAEGVIDALSGIARSGRPPGTGPSWLRLPEEVWTDPRLFCDCPRCGRPLRFTPFLASRPTPPATALAAGSVAPSAPSAPQGRESLVAHIDSPETRWTRLGLASPVGILLADEVERLLADVAEARDPRGATREAIAGALSPSGALSWRVTVLHKFAEVLKFVAEDDPGAVEDLLNHLVDHLGWCPEHPLADFVQQAARDACVRSGFAVLPYLFRADSSARASSPDFSANLLLAAGKIAPEDGRVRALLEQTASDSLPAVRRRVLALVADLPCPWAIRLRESFDPKPKPTKRPEPSKHRLVPTEEEIASIPHWARVAYVARCARLWEGKLELWGQCSSEDSRRQYECHKDTIPRAIQELEQAAAAADRRKCFDRTAVKAAVAAAKRCKYDGPFFFDFVIRAAELVDYGFRAAGATSVQDAVRLTTRVGELAGYNSTIEHDVRHIFQCLEKAARRHQWTDDTPVPADIFGS